MPFLLPRIICTHSTRSQTDAHVSFRGPHGAKMIGDIAGKITCVDHLDLADNAFGDAGLAMLVEVRFIYGAYVVPDDRARACATTHR